MAINSLVDMNAAFSATMMVSLIVLTLLCIPLLWKGLGVTNPYQIAFTTAAFPVWALNISSARLIDQIDPATLGVILILVTVAIPLIPTSPRVAVEGEKS